MVGVRVGGTTSAVARGARQAGPRDHHNENIWTYNACDYIPGGALSINFPPWPKIVPVARHVRNPMSYNGNHALEKD